MKNRIRVLILSAVASGLIILTLVWLAFRLCKLERIVMIVPVAEASNISIATTTKINTIEYWLALQSSTKNSWSLPDYLTGVPRTRIINDLISCESGGNAKALNPVDRDKTASYGILQFKPSTLLQINTAGYMIMDNWKNSSWWLQQFPDCFKKYRKRWGV